MVTGRENERERVRVCTQASERETETDKDREIKRVISEQENIREEPLVTIYFVIFI